MLRIFFKMTFIFLLISCRQEVSFSPTPDIPIGGTIPRPSEGGTDVITEPEEPPVGPVVRLLTKPKSHFLGEQTQTEFEIILGDHPLKNLSCDINGSPLNCEVGSNQFEIKGLDIGSYTISIFVEDTLGLKAQADSQWIVTRVYQSVSSHHIVQAGSNKADVLFVIDNSGSMQEEQTEIGNRINRFFDKLKILDWRVGIVTTDPYEIDPITNRLNPLADGVLLRFPNGAYHLKSNLSQSTAQSYFEKTIFRPEIGNGHERGIYNTYRSIERSENPTSEADRRLRDFYRNDASLSVVLISDEDETLLDGASRPLWDQAKSDGNELIQKVKQVWGDKKLFRFNSVIVRPGDNACIKTHEKFGYAYDQLSRATQGVVENICATDYSGALQNIADQVLNLQKSYLLNCEPQDIDGDGQIEFEIRKEGRPQNLTYIFNKNQVEFEKPLDFGSYQFNYFCL